jgi:hypothetical protein
MPEESTTPDRVDRVQQRFEALSRRGLDGFLSTWAPDAARDLNAWGIGTFEARAAAERLAHERG